MSQKKGAKGPAERASGNMSASKSLQEAVYGVIFPGGMIPFRCKDNILAIDARISEIEELAKGKVVEGMNRRYGKADSARLTAQIVELRDSCSPPMNYREIVRRLGHCITPVAARNRYDDAKKAAEDAAMQKEGYAAISSEAQEKIESGKQFSDATKLISVTSPSLDMAGPMHIEPQKIETDILPAVPAPIQPEKPVQVEEATIRNSQIVEKVEGVKPDDATLRNGAKVYSEVEKEVTQEVTQEATKQPQNSHIVDLTQKGGEYERHVVPVPKGVVEEILRLSKEGTPVRGISNALAKKGILIDWRRVRGIISNAARGDSKKHREEARKAEEAALRSAANDGFGPLSDQARAAKNVEKRTSAPQNVAPMQPEATPDPSLPGAEGAQEAARANPRGSPEEHPEPKFISRYALNEKVWAGHKAGKTPEQISDELCSEGYYYGKERVRRMLIQQGADL